ncbi:MBL fold metallo-hydrolase [Desulfosudis oleivorans]|uniref:Beta-lactamase domain protein n=1 Tax=Desulfosudis oleivorans (strain DSM 6200 / JCM 39069 / Hxd3) TaxID=96561 RepID=A8ZS52_DESOH|nr:MBL fold metallo-hydrolase [Desulfosudis oleivorans]ABW66070.1 beta-lactamase domain protein [Desulfosudis oleivorans Hxd3]
MQIIPHKGTHMIGGTCVELRAEGQGLLLDMGMPLVNPNGTEFDENTVKRPIEKLMADDILPRVPGLYDKSECNLAGIVLTHAHRDHFGLSQFVKPDIPIFAGQTTADLIGAIRLFFPDQLDPARLTIIKAHWQPVTVGPFTIKSHPVDHSAPGAMAVEVEAAGKKVFFTGDLRAHGYKYRTFENLLKNPPKNVDAMLMEGSSLGRGPTEYAYPDESSVKEALINEIKDDPNLVLLFCSSQNVDRVVSACRAAQATGRELVMDYYTAYILYLLKNTSRNIPQFFWDEVRLLSWPWHVHALEENGHKGFVITLNNKGGTVKPEEIFNNPDKFLVLAKPNRTLPTLTKGLGADQITCMWSMWSGYLKDPEKNFAAFLRTKNIPDGQIKHIHTSGHATIKDLGRLVKAVNPGLLIPIHTFHPDDYDQFIDPARVKVLNDGDVWEI